jgi:aspartate/methionine/tyrosine aminotransferase
VTAQGLPELRSKVAEQLSANVGLRYAADDIVITLGTKHALFLAVHAICHTCDRVLVTCPGWPGHRGAVVAAGATPTDVPASGENNFLLDPKTLERTWQPRTRALILASPANPTGSVYVAEHRAPSLIGPLDATSGSFATMERILRLAPTKLRPCIARLLTVREVTLVAERPGCA